MNVLMNEYVNSGSFLKNMFKMRGECEHNFVFKLFSCAAELIEAFTQSASGEDDLGP